MSRHNRFKNYSYAGESSDNRTCQNSSCCKKEQECTCCMSCPLFPQGLVGARGPAGPVGPAGSGGSGRRAEFCGLLRTDATG